MSLTNQIRVGFFALAALVAGVAALAIDHSNRSIGAVDVNLSVVTPTRIGLTQVSSLLADSRSAFLKYDRRDRTTASDSLEFLTRLVEVERQLIASLPGSEAAAKLRQRPANRARVAFFSYLDEIAVDRSGDTAIGLRHDVDGALRDFRTSLIERESAHADATGTLDIVRQAGNVLNLAETTLGRFDARSQIDFSSVTVPVQRALVILENLPISNLSNTRLSGDRKDFSHIIEDIANIRRPVQTVRVSLFSYKPGLFTNPLAVDFSACDASLVAGSFAAGESRVLPQLCDSHLRHERREEAAVEASGTATGDPAVA